MTYIAPGERGRTIGYVYYSNGEEDYKREAWADLFPAECAFCHQVRPIIDIDTSNGEYPSRYICEECMTRAFRLFDAEYIPDPRP